MRQNKTYQGILHRFTAGILLLSLAAMTIFSAGCTGNGGETVAMNPNQPETEVGYTGQDVEKLELYHFHGVRSCSSCTVLGDFAEEAVTEWYAPELESGMIVFEHVNFDNSNSSELVDRYGPTGSSLWLGIYDANGFHAQELVAPWYMINDKEQFTAYIRAVIQQQLA